ncbi:SagB/ThcOx family dehydrogenase [Vallitalea maricola]|uniref:SagB/ThcOx family dehydrogenase n=1 Tax=Vallitalea maricola TaxID=3074433 RepID=A0ACB5UGL7_9FIRM|nr:SagB/ThcOx family dehydrogenase [Vallitalea sp. AN17-2]
MNSYELNRNFMKSSLDDYDLSATADLAKGEPQPDIQKPINENSKVIELPQITLESVPKADYYELIASRLSRRAYSEIPISLKDLSFLLWCTQGVKKVIGGYRRLIKDGSGRNYLRYVASGGCINPFDTYLVVNNVQEVEQGVWKYLPLTHQLVFEKEIDNMSEKISKVFTNKSQNQSYTSKAGVIFFWVCVPYRGEWRYKETAHKTMLLDLGHISHQLYLATEVINCGCCAIGGYYQDKADSLIGVDGEKEFTSLCATVGHIIDSEKNWIDRYPDARINPDYYKLK